MKSNYQIKVGIVVLLGIAVLLGIYWFFDQFRLYKTTYPIYAVFSNALRLQNGADVRLAGVKIGRVESIVLTPDSRARVDMLIQIENRIPQDSIAKVTTGAMIGDPYVEILPGKSRGLLTEGKEIASLQPPTFDEMLMEVDVLVKKFQHTADAVNAVLSDKEMVNQVKDIAKSLNNAINGAAGLMASTKSMIDENRPGLKSTMSNVEMATRNAAVLSKRLDRMMAEDAQPNIKALLEEAKKSAENLNSAIVSANNLLAGFQDTPGKVNSILTKADSAADQATGMLTNLDKASEGIKELATDQELKDNIRKTVRNAATVSENAKETVNKLNAVLTRRGPRIDPNKDVIPEYGTSIYSLWNTHTNEMRVDAAYTFALNNKAFYRLGIHNIGSNSKLNLMAGKTLDRRNAVRYGIFASELGAGYDYKMGERNLLSAELYNPNDPTLDIRSITSINDNLGLYLGASDLFHNDNRAFIFGVRAQQ